MKTSLKIGVLAAAVMFSISSCGDGDRGHKVIDTVEKAIDTTQKTIDTTKKAGVEPVKKDSVKK
jgi:hypothetical protein